jgi:hypothetical protein
MAISQRPWPIPPDRETPILISRVALDRSDAICSGPLGGERACVFRASGGGPRTNDCSREWGASKAGSCRGKEVNVRRIHRLRRKLARCVRRRGWVLFRSLVVDSIALGLVALGVLARTAESTDAAIQRSRLLELTRTPIGGVDGSSHAVTSLVRR